MTERWWVYVNEITRRENMVFALCVLGALLVAGWLGARWGVRTVGLERWWPLAYAAGLALYLQTVWLCWQML
jgi:hypothetical protein